MTKDYGEDCTLYDLVEDNNKMKSKKYPLSAGLVWCGGEPACNNSCQVSLSLSSHTQYARFAPQCPGDCVAGGAEKGVGIGRLV